MVFKRKIAVKGKGLEKPCFCYLADTTISFLRILLNGVDKEVYNFGNPYCEISIKNLAKLISNFFPDRKIQIKFERIINKKKYLKSSVIKLMPSIEKIKKLGWLPKTSLEESFSRTINSFVL